MSQIYKVFVNNWFIIFSDSDFQQETLNLNQANNLCKMVSSHQDIINLLHRNNYVLECNLFCVCSNPKKSFSLFKSYFHFIIAAGGLVQNKKKELLIIYKNSMWDLPKGKVENKESFKETAIREVTEETNVSELSIISKSHFSTYHIYLELSPQSHYCLKETKWFLMKTESDCVLMPQFDEGIFEVKWVTGNEFTQLSTYCSINSVIKHFNKL
tara:strand:- start:1430 stop:2068 length:639 start_codon:yes stop_codon:yes gene_type:complete